MMADDALCLPQPLWAQAQARPHHWAVRDAAGDGMRYRALAVDAARRAQALRQAGVAPQQRVALRLEGSVEALRWLHALWWLGAAVVPLPARDAALSLQARLAACRPHWLLQRPGDGAPSAALAGEAAGAPQPLCAATLAASAAGCPSVTDPATMAAPRPWQLGDVVARITTSGTTGAPAPVDLYASQVTFSAFASATRLGHAIDDTWLAVLPLHHVGGLSILLRALLCGSSVQVHPRFDAAAVARVLHGGSVQLTSLVPAMLADVLRCAPYGPFSPRLRAILLGGAPAPAALLAAAQARALPVAVTWGMSEAASQIATHWPGTLPHAPGDVGPPLPFAHVWADADARLHVACALVRAPLRTQDVGCIDPRGHVVVHGRSDDVFISGGENVHPAPIEARLMAHEAIGDAAVVGVADARWGQVPAAFLVARADAARPSDAALATFCRAALASYQVPVQFVWLPELPRDSLGKLRRGALCTDATGHAAQATFRRSP